MIKNIFHPPPSSPSLNPSALIFHLFCLFYDKFFLLYAFLFL